MNDFIFLLGAQGSGKTTIARILKEKLGSPHIDFDWIRGFHLNKDWSNTNNSEERMSIKNLIYLLENYVKNDYKNIIVSGFTEMNIKQVLEELKEYKYKIITLTIKEDDVLKKRVLNESRDSGFRNYEQSIEFNNNIKDSLQFPNETKIDNTYQTPQETVEEIIDLVN